MDGLDAASVGEAVAAAGPDAIVNQMIGYFPLLAKVEARVEVRELNGHPGAVLRDRNGKVAGTMALDVVDGRIQTIRSVVNPDKLGHLGPVADAWAVAHEIKLARRRPE